MATNSMVARPYPRRFGYDNAVAGDNTAPAPQGNAYGDGQVVAENAGAFGPAPQRGTFGGPVGSQPDLNTHDPNKLIRNAQTYAYGQGQNLDTQMAQEQQYQAGLEQRYRPGMEQAYGQLQQTPGYTAEEQTGMLRTPEVYGYQATQGQFQGMNPNATETAGIQGNPYGGRDIAVETSANMTGDLGKTAGQLSGMEQQQAVDQGNTVNGYGSVALNNLGAGQGAVRGAIDYNKLGLNATADQRMQMTDKDVQDIENQAGTTVQNRYASAIGDLARNANAAGNATPMAVAAARARLENQSAAGAGDAMTNARIQATQAQRQATAQAEGMRLGAEQGYAGLSSANEQELAQRNLANTQYWGQMANANANTLAANRYANTQYAGTERANATMNTGQMRLGAQQQGEAAAQQRASDLYNTRRQNAQYGIDTTYGQGMGIAGQQSATTQQIGQARQAGQGEYRGYLAGQTGAASAGVQQGFENRGKTYATETGSANQGAGTQAQYNIGQKNAPSPLEKYVTRPISQLAGAAKNTSDAKAGW
jgi:hypothetical protein